MRASVRIPGSLKLYTYGIALPLVTVRARTRFVLPVRDVHHNVKTDVCIMFFPTFPKAVVRGSDDGGSSRSNHWSICMDYAYTLNQETSQK